ncbi:unnamed protein product [Cuscuta europaea]|uniref:Uncharacterized protein n=1 Tax=Cuscuta europaea TaxID=41803 RepID=A0A9P0ZB54_CUSEU|nr:unnamed protein product [Cuscuta europaea]
MAGWNYPEIALEEFLKAIKGFVDMLILASGYQSSGSLAHWDSSNIKKALQWALLIEDVIGHLSSRDEYRDSLQEFNKNLCQIISNPYFPKGLEHLSSKTLKNARNLMLEHLIHSLPLRDPHLRALVAATVEMDSHKHMEKLLQNESRKLAFDSSRQLIEESSNTEANSATCSFSFITARELQRRLLGVSSVSATEKLLNILSHSVYCLSLSELGKNLPDGVANIGALMYSEMPVDPFTWSHMRSRNLSYFLDKRTIRMVSGASLIFSAPEDQRANVFGRLSILTDDDATFSEAVELLLLGCAARKWEVLIKHFMSTSYEPVTLSKLCKEVLNLMTGHCKNICCKDNMMSSKDISVVRFLEGWLSSRLHIWWNLSPILAAFAIPSWSLLFKSYIRELESHFRGDSSLTRFSKDGKELKECDIVDRMWCLYIYHIRGST